jgi:hypothetical protein
MSCKNSLAVTERSELDATISKKGYSMRRCLLVATCIVLVTARVESADDKVPSAGDLKSQRLASARQLIDAARNAIRNENEKDPEIRLMQFSRLAHAQALVGESAAARQSLENMSALIKDLPKESSHGTFEYCEMAEIQVRLGDTAAARNSLRSAKSLAPLDTSDGEDGVVSNYESISGLELTLDDCEGAKETVEAAKRIAEKLNRAYVYRSLAEMQIGLKDFGAARDTLEKLKAVANSSREPDSNARAFVAELQAKLDDFEAAKTTLAAVDDANVLKVNAYELIAEQQAEKGKYDDAKATIALISKKHEPNRQAARARLALHQAEAKNVSAAKATIEGMTDIRVKSFALRLVGSIQIKSGDLAGAFATAEQIRSQTPKKQPEFDYSAEECECASQAFAALLLRQIAEAQTDATEAEKYLDLAKQAAEKSKVAAAAVCQQTKGRKDADQKRSWTWLESATAQAMAGDVDSILQSARENETVSPFAYEYFCYVAEELALIDKPEEGFLTLTVLL